ncbi:hypothetical protein NON00_08365 [Roseomonas sp. GC11]|uniref:hypothetical protein n=1 Tax=Roseomonas sp. GC11 TaxID=2950546 RepID=UPI00210B6156|nr:hypothetical protein [Roseomonas sp. GC11]MCQ4159942.1 hypothetical protein [Roseomonas sp. GC11]
MIEATQSVKQQTSASENAYRVLPRPADSAERTPATPATGEVLVAERQKQITAVIPSFDIRLDLATMQLYTEMRDPSTDRVLLRLAAGYRPQSQENETSRDMTFA